jgi:hypothetical protein
MSSRSRLIVLVAALATVLPAPAAPAKGIATASVCGAGGCTTVTERAQGFGRCSGCSAEQLLAVLPGSARPARRAPYLRIVLGFGSPHAAADGRERVLFAPSLRLAARSDGVGGWAWFRPSRPALALAARMVRGIRPYPAAGMPLDPRPRPTATRLRAMSGDDDAQDSLIVPGGAAAAVLGIGIGGLAARQRRRRV